jgi:polysaccharide pyruvyl transferase WcaK-like protein
MKIGILSLPLHVNYGGILQAYALQNVLKRLGHEIVVFNIEKESPKLQLKMLPKRIIKRLLGKKTIIFKEWRDKKENPIVEADILSFRKRYLNEMYLNAIEDIQDIDLDAIVVGSDQVWRPKYFCNMWKTGIENAYLYFLKKKKINKVAYAVSLGVDFWEANDKETSFIREVSPLFSSISVREQSAMKLLNRYAGVSSTCVLDPTFLLNDYDYLSLAGVKEKKDNPVLWVYLLNPSKEKLLFVRRVANEKNLTLYFVNKIDVSENSRVDLRKKTSIEVWLESLANSSFIITDSFHACIFSIIFQKSFLALGNVLRGQTRFNSLLDTFKLKKNLITSLEEYNSQNDWSVTSQSIEILNELKEKSLKFLKKSLN